MRRFLATLALCWVVLSPLFVQGCTERNAEGRSVVSFMPGSVLNAQAASIYAESKQKEPISKDGRLTAVNQRVADRLIAQAQQHYGTYCQGFQWEVTLFDQPTTQNAYCMPGGKIGIYTGILPVCQNEAALAAVMGHEIAHALLNHGNERASQQLGTAAILAGAGAVMESKDVKDSKREKIMIALGLGAQFGVLLPYSRDHENEADKLGLKLMALAGYDPAEAPNLWRRMNALGGAGLPEFFSTHPASAHRVQNLERLQEEVRPMYEGAARHYGKGDTL